jgi:18S rRNA (adenine1779-N6/adenine1780-N6)-dimethyltransferase
VSIDDYCNQKPLHASIHFTTHAFIFINQIRLLFNRKNKTLRSVLLTKPTIKMLDENRRTQKALNNGNNNNECGMMEEEEEKGAEQIIEEVVALEQWKDKRASKLDLDDFLALLAEFNKRGIHFA